MVYVFLADGFEEVEALTQIDLLRRAGAEVVSVGINGCKATGAHGICVCCDVDINSCDAIDAEMIVLPGGMPGVTNLFSCTKLLEIIIREYNAGAYIAAICAAPLILGRLGLSEKRNMICYPGFEHELKNAIISDKEVVKDGNIITGKAAGSAFAFAHELISVIKGVEAADSVLDGIYYEK